MLIFGTQIHIVTFIFIVLEFCMFIFQLARYFYRLQDKHLGWYLVLLFLLLFYNIALGLYPDPRIDIPIPIQNMLAHGSCFLMASFFPYYFYKAFDLKPLRWHALFGVPLFLMLPYLVFFVIAYAINGNLKADIRYGVIIPFFYSFILLWAILSAIRRRYKENRNRRHYMEEIAVYCAMVPWGSITVFSWFQASQLAQVLCTNTGFVIITIMFLWESVRRTRIEYYLNLTNNGISPELFLANCLHYGLTRAEILIVQMLYKGMSNKEIADKSFISEETVKKHIQNIFRKTVIKNRAALMHKLQNRRD